MDSELSSQTEEKMTSFPLEVVEVIKETDDASSIIFNISPEFSSKFTYKAGQFITFKIPWKDFFISRSYSLSSSPATSELPTITVKRVDDGRGSNWFNDLVKPGMKIMASPPSGRFTLRENKGNPLILFAGGSGITPIISIVKTTLLTSNRPVMLLYANRDQKSIIFHTKLANLLKKYSDRFTCHHHLDSDGKYLQPNKIHQFIDGNWHADFYICGPTPFMDLVENTLHDRAVDQSRIFIERFSSPLDPDRKPSTEPQVHTPDAVDDVKLTITLNGSECQIPYQKGKTLLDCVITTEIEGVPYSCQQGHCGSCMAILRKGEVTMRENHVLSKRDLEKGYVLACQSLPKTEEIWIDFDE